jgi:molybdenum cofactor cytidylyltransferase
MDDCAPHATEPLASPLRRIERDCDLVVIFGGSAISDRCDVVPSAIEKANGCIEHFGMPVNPAICFCLDRFPVRARTSDRCSALERPLAEEKRV